MANRPLLALYPSDPVAETVVKTVVETVVIAAVVKATGFDGRDGPGPCKLAGAKAGDKVVDVFGLSGRNAKSASNSFEPVITVADEIQQVADRSLSGNGYLAILQAT